MEIVFNIVDVSKSIRILLTISILMLLFSCQSSKKLQLDEMHHQRAISAIQLLGSDMLDNLEIEIPITALERSLLESYTIYSSYFPLYSEYRDSYLEKLSLLASEGIKSFYSDIYDEVLVLAQDPERFLSDDTSLTTALRSKLRRVLIAKFYVMLMDYEPELSDAFSQSSRDFNSIREAYLNLKSVGFDLSLPIAEQADLHIVSEVAVDSLFDSMAETERTLKNKIVDRSSDSLYSIFWEGR